MRYGADYWRLSDEEIRWAMRRPRRRCMNWRRFAQVMMVAGAVVFWLTALFWGSW